MIVPDELLESLRGGLSLMVACCGSDGRAVCTRGVGLRISADRQNVTLFLPRATASPLSGYLLERPSIAFVVSRPNDYRTIQLKGNARAVRDAPDSDRAQVEEFIRKFADVVDQYGVPRQLALRVAHWPCLAVDVEVTEIFGQTPGPGAGAPLLPGAS